MDAYDLGRHSVVTEYMCCQACKGTGAGIAQQRSSQKSVCQVAWRAIVQEAEKHQVICSLTVRSYAAQAEQATAVLTLVGIHVILSA